MEVNLLTHADALAEIRPVWLSWQNQPNNDFDQFLLICRIRPEVHYPWVMVAYEDGIPIALLAGRVETIPFAPSIGYIKPISIPVKTLTLLYDGFLGRNDLTVSTLFRINLQKWLRHNDVIIATFPQLHIDSPIRSVLIDQTSPLFCEKNLTPQLHWQGVLSTTTDNMLKRMKSKHRSAILKRERAFTADFSGRIAWQWLTCFDDISVLCLEIENLASRTYQRGFGTGFMDNLEHRQRLGLYADRGLLRVALLKLDDNLIGFCVGIIYNNILYGSELGYDRQYKNYTPGIILIIWMMEKLLEEGINHIDWGLGDAQYKRQLSTFSWYEQSILLFKPNLVGLGLRTILKSTLLTDKMARFILKKTELTGSIKSLWRKSVARSIES